MCIEGKFSVTRSEPGAQMALAGLIGGLGHSAVDELAGIVNEVVPLKRRARVHFVGLDMEVAKDTLVILELVIGQFVRDEFTGRVARVVAPDFRKHFAQRSRKPDEGLVLLGREIVLNQIRPLNGAPDRFWPGRVTNKAFGANASIAKAWRDVDSSGSVRLAGVPLLERVLLIEAVGAQVGDLDAYRAAVGGGRMPGPFLEVEGLVNRAIEVEHKMHAQIAMVLQNVKALPAGAARVEVNHKLIDDLLEQRQIPSAAAHALKLLVGQAVAAQVVAVGRSQFTDFLFGMFP